MKKLSIAILFAATLAVSAETASVAAKRIAIDNFFILIPILVPEAGLEPARL